MAITSVCKREKRREGHSGRRLYHGEAGGGKATPIGRWLCDQAYAIRDSVSLHCFPCHSDRDEAHETKG